MDGWMDGWTLIYIIRESERELNIELKQRDKIGRQTVEARYTLSKIEE